MSEEGVCSHSCSERWRDTPPLLCRQDTYAARSDLRDRMSQAIAGCVLGQDGQGRDL